MRDKCLLSFGGLFSAPLCLYAFLFFYAERVVPIAAICVGIAVTVVAAVVVMPLLYDWVNSSIIVSTGRYHLPLAIVTLLAPLATAIVFSFGRTSNPAAAGILFSVTLPVSVLSILTFLYLYGSICSRLVENGDKHFVIMAGLTQIVGALAFLLCYFVPTLIQYGQHLSIPGQDVPTNAAAAGQLVSALFLIGAGCVYAASVQYMPRFIRLEPPKVRTLKEKYRRFYVPFLSRSNLLPLLGYTLGMAAVLSFTLNVPFTLINKFQVWYVESLYTLLAVIGAFAAVVFLTGKFITPKRLFVLWISAAVLTMLGSFGNRLIFLAFPAVPGPLNFWKGAGLVLTGLCVGAGGGIFAAIKNYHRQEVRLNSSVYNGVALNFYNIAFVCAFALAVLLSAFAVVFDTGYHIVVALEIVLLSAVVISLAFVAKRETGFTMCAVDVTDTIEIITDIGADEPAADEPAADEPAAGGESETAESPAEAEDAEAAGTMTESADEPAADGFSEAEDGDDTI